MSGCRKVIGGLSLYKISVLVVIATISIGVMGLEDISIAEMERLYNSKCITKDTLVGDSIFTTKIKVYQWLDSLLTCGMANDSAKIAWGVSQAVVSLVKMYDVTGKKSYLDSAARYVNKIILLRDDKRSVPQYDGTLITATSSYLNKLGEEVIKPAWRNVSYSSYNKGTFTDTILITRYDEEGNRINVNYKDVCFGFQYVIHTGVILRPMIELGIILDRDNLWHNVGLDWERASYINIVKQSIQRHDEEWETIMSSDGSGYGVYEWSDSLYWRVIAFTGGDTVPCNQMYGMGSTLVRMYDWLKEVQYKEKAELLMKSFKRIMNENERDAYCWNYKYINYSDLVRADDISHGVYSSAFANDYYRSNMVQDASTFTEEDMKKLANTYMRNLYAGDIRHTEWAQDGSGNWFINKIVNPDGTYDFYPTVSGDTIAESKYYIDWARSNVCNWIPLCEYDARVYESAFNVIGDNNYIGISNLLKFHDDYKPAIITLNIDSLKYNFDNNLAIKFDEIRMLGDLSVKVTQGSKVYYENKIEKSKTDTLWSANIIFTALRTKNTEPLIVKYWSDNNGILGPSREYVIPVVGETLYVSHRDEIPVLKIEDIRVEVTKVPIPDPQPDGYEYQSIPGCTIELHYFDGEVDTGVTNSMGVVDWNDNIISSTYLLKVVAYKDGYFPDTSYIEPYMWSTIQDAMGPSSSKHVIKNDKDESVHLIYTDGDSIVHGRSTDFGANWELEKIGHGDYASITQIIDTDSVGMAAVWKDGESWVYDWSMSPWVGEDTVSPTVMGYRNPVITANPSNRKEVWLGGIMTNYGTMDNYWTLQYAGFNYRNPDASQITEIISEEGEYNSDQLYTIKPYNNASIGSKLWGSLYGAVIAFEDTNSEIIEKQFNPIYPEKWLTSTNRSNTSTKSSNPFVNTENYTDVNKVIWEEEGSSSGAYGSRIYLDNARFKYDKTETDKKYPKIIKGIVSYVESGNKVVISPQLYDSTKGNIILSSLDSCYHPDFIDSMRINLTLGKKYYKLRVLWTEKSDSEFRIKSGYTEIVTDTTDDGWGIDNLPLTLADTAILTEGVTSYLKDYLPSGDKQKIERISSTMTGLNKYKDYLLVVKTTNPNKNQPYVVAIDEKLGAVITKKEATTEVVLKSVDYEDGEIEVYLDRVKGSTNRTVEFNLYEYDEIIGGATVLKGTNILKLTDENEGIEESLEMSRINGKTIKMSINSMTDSEIGIELIDISGRVVLKETEKIKKGKNQISVSTEGLSSGVYFYRMKKDGAETISGKLTVIK